jgi:hypothetical protein
VPAFAPDARRFGAPERGAQVPVQPRVDPHLRGSRKERALKNNNNRGAPSALKLKRGWAAHLQKY